MNEMAPATITQHDFTGIREKIKAKEYTQAAVLLEKIPAAYLTVSEMAEMEELISALPQDKDSISPRLYYTMALFKLLKGDERGAKAWCSQLNARRDALREGSQERAVLENYIAALNIAMPLKDNAGLLLNLAIFANNASEAKISSVKLSVTGKFPSVLRGAKDLSDWGKNYGAVESIVKPYLSVFLEDSAAGVCDVAIAELLYEKNHIGEASLRVMAGVNVEHPKIAFAALALMARIGTVDKTAKSPEKMIACIEKMIEQHAAKDLRANFEAFKARYAILRGDVKAVRQWLETCGADDIYDCNRLNFYVLLSKAKAYIALGEYRQAATLLESLILMLQSDYRPLDRMECLANSAIAMELLGQRGTAFQKLEEALKIGQEFGYIRVFADNGKQMFHLLAQYAKAGSIPEEVSELYLKKLIDASSAFSVEWPAIYVCDRQAGEAGEGDQTPLTNSELLILQLLEKGSTYKVIAKKLDIKETTVKFHISNLYEKLGASNRVEALNAARVKKMLV